MASSYTVSVIVLCDHAYVCVSVCVHLQDAVISALGVHDSGMVGECAQLEREIHLFLIVILH